MTREEIQDFTLRITHANKTEMIVVLYDIILCYTRDAKENLQAQDIKAFRTSINKLRNSFVELINSVDTSIDLGLNLLKLYVFCQGEITRAVTRSEASHLDNVKNVISGLRDSYSQISGLDTSGSVMENTQKVYSGLTYNTRGQGESMLESASNRGYFA